MPRLGSNIAKGQYTGTLEAFDININFKPHVVQVYKATTGEYAFKSRAHPNATCIVYRLISVSGSNVLTSESRDNCITLNRDKITIGASPYVNNTGVLYYYIING